MEKVSLCPACTACPEIVMEGDTGSFSTGQASGAAGMIVSCALAQVQAGLLASPLTSNEVKQIITLTAEDVVPENTGGNGIPDPSQPGWDQHFGYGRVNLRAAMDKIAPQVGESCLSTGPHANTIPPEAGIESPAWFAPLDPVTSPTKRRLWPAGPQAPLLPTFNPVH